MKSYNARNVLSQKKQVSSPNKAATKLATILAKYANFKYI
jgi:hypothetical protein